MSLMISKAGVMIWIYDLQWKEYHYIFKFIEIDNMLLFDYSNAEIVLCMHPANERQHYIVTSSLTGWAHTQNDAW